MSELLCLRFRDSQLTGATPVAWSLLTPAGQIEASGYALLRDLAELLPGDDVSRRCVVIMPGDAAFVSSVDVPAKQQRHAKQLVPFLVEEQIVEPIEVMHLAMPVLHVAERVSVAAIRRSLLEAWLATLSEFAIAPDYLFLDVLCVPRKNGDWQLLFDNAALLFRDGQNSGMVLTPQTADTVLKLALAASPDDAGEAGGDERDLDALVNEAAAESSDIINRAAQRAERDAMSAAKAARVVLLDSESAEQERKAWELLLANAGGETGADAASHGDPQEASDEEEIAHDPHEAALLGEDYVNPGDSEFLQVGSGTQSSVESGTTQPPEKWLDNIDALVRSENVSTAHVRYSETVSEMLAISAVQSLDSSLNLLQGDFRPATANAAQRRFLRKISGAVAACVALFVIITLGGGFYLNTRADHFFDKSVAMYRDLFPKQRKVIDPVRQMKRQLRGGSVGATVSDFLPLLDAASRSLQVLDNGDGEEPSIKQLRYDTQRGHIAIDLHAGNIDQLEAYRDLLAEEGLEVDILSANQDGDTIKGRIQVGRS